MTYVFDHKERAEPKNANANLSKRPQMTNETPSFWRAIKSVLAAFFGVQSDKNRELDFKYGKPAHFIMAGLLLTLLFILVVWGVVKLVLNAASL